MAKELQLRETKRDKIKKWKWKLQTFCLQEQEHYQNVSRNLPLDVPTEGLGNQ